jgi:holliday junction DNA helicase RuvA
MLNYITGTITKINDKMLTIDTGPLGLAIVVPNAQLFEMGKLQKLYLHMHWNQEQGPSLYGFVHEHERTLFLLIIGCSGIGPKIAMAVLATMGSALFVAAIQDENPKALAQVPGIGIKKAEQIIVHLKHKVSDMMTSFADMPVAKTGNDWHSVSQALESLNYSRAEINTVMHHVRQKNEGATASFDQLLRQALSFLAKQL